MKISNKIKDNISKLILLSLVISFTGCNEYLDVDTDLDSPKVAPLDYLLSNIELNLSQIGDFNNNTGQILAVYTHSMTAREDEDQYGVKVDNVAMQNDWNSIYLTLTDIQSLVNQADATGNKVYVGIGQLQKAYLMSVAVDLWGDVPYTEANRLKEGVKNPKFDNQKQIYTEVFNLIDQAKINIASNSGLKKPSKDDFIYNGDINKWIRFANTLKLKLYNQTRLSTNFDQVGFDALILENNFFTSNLDDFEFKHNDDISKSNERNLLFRDSYESTQFGSYQSPWFYEILKGVNPNIHTNNPDPRMKYYFYNQLKANIAFPLNVGSASNPGADYWDKATGFFSIRFGSTGPDRDKSAEDSYTYPGIFPCGGRYDDGLGGSVAIQDNNTKFSGTGAAPKRMLTYDEFLYIQAELINEGKLPGSAITKLNQAVRASFAKVDKVALVAKNSTQVIPVLVGSAAVNTFITKLTTEFNAASADKKLEIIMTQKWVATYGDPLDQYNDYRRTGYPVLANPLGSSPEYQLDNANGFPLNDAQTILNSAYQISFFWPQQELNSNSNAPSQKNATTYKIFWDN
jgi:Starch-binding associating with outer membrane